MRRAALFAALLFAMAARTLADIAQPSPLPAGLSDSSNLATEREALMAQWNGLQQKITSQNTQCSQVAEDSPLVETCRSNQAAILADLTAYKNSLKGYEDALAQTPVQSPKPTNNLTSKKPIDLSKDPDAARLSQARLQEVEARMKRLQKAMDLLSYRDNPHWAHDYEALMKEMRDTSAEQYWLALDLVSSGMAARMQDVAAQHIKVSQQAVDLPIWKNIARERAGLEKLSRAIQGAEGDGIRKTITALSKLEAARHAGEEAEAFGFLQEAITTAKDGYDQAKDVLHDPRAMDALYAGSAIVGKTASLFAEEGVKKMAAPVDTGFKFIEAGLLVKEYAEESEQLQALSDRSYDRHQKQNELSRTMGDLQEERARLQWAVQKAQ